MAYVQWVLIQDSTLKIWDICKAALRPSAKISIEKKKLVRLQFTQLGYATGPSNNQGQGVQNSRQTSSSLR
jgi:hypothetical protein